MSVAVMPVAIERASPRFKARMAGVFYFLTFLTGGVAFLAHCRLMFGLADLSVTPARKVSVPLHSGPRHPRGRIADPMAPRGGRERPAMEGAGRRNG